MDDGSDGCYERALLPFLFLRCRRRGDVLVLADERQVQLALSAERSKWQPKQLSISGHEEVESFVASGHLEVSDAAKALSRSIPPITSNQSKPVLRAY